MYCSSLVFLGSIRQYCRTSGISLCVRSRYGWVDKPYFRKLFRQTIENIETVDFSISPYIDRAFDELDPIETAILRLAVYELRFELDVPYKVVINEAIEVAKVFGADESHKYINGVLDKIAPALGRK